MKSSLTQILHEEIDTPPKVRRRLLREQVTDLLRDYIVTGRIPPGTQLVERELVDLLGISRVPIREALLELQKEGLIVDRAHRRYVVYLTERDVRELSQVRLALEKEAVALAAEHTSPENKVALLENLRQMEAALEQRDKYAFHKLDMEAHMLIWKQADNRHLLATLRTIVGPIFVLMFQNLENYDWHTTLELHRELVACINNGDREEAVHSIERHLAEALRRAILWAAQNNHPEN
ncbi:MAG: GntR family transcriptional regulator [Litorilinea sp.]|nr:MAG: GntR family transcriptional regulator [Litorilinea sp.]